jgi:hypothetical protein
MPRHVVYVHTHRSQLLPALVAVHSLRSRGGAANVLDVRLLQQHGTELDERRDGQPYRARGDAVWDHTHPSTSHYLRRWVPELVGFRGRALVVDPDVFAVRSILPLFELDMGGKAVLCQYRANGYADDGRPTYLTGVMLLDCPKLTHWCWHDEVVDLFAGRLDYWDMLQLVTEPKDNVGELEDRWNSLDILTDETRLLHFTRLSTQPWAAGLPLPHDLYDPTAPIPEPSWWQRRLGIRPQRHCRRHPDPAQERLFVELLAECLAQGLVPEAFVRSEQRAGHIRRDMFAMLQGTGYHAGRGEGTALLDEFGIPTAPSTLPAS